ncbi:MAG: metallophosphoesterase [Caulobacteraceae bacterium]|nr:metallophosphoesterase [Caulobacteraceae bacterium]
MRIALVSDTHFDSNDQLLVENWRAVERWLRTTSPDLVVHLGDITAKGSADETELRFARDVLAGSSFAIHAIPGNHDIGDCPTRMGQTPEEPLVPERLADYRRLFGPDRWRIEADGWRLIGLNALLMATGLAEEEAQFEWLAQALAQGDGPVGVFLHKPLFRDHIDEDIVHLRYVAKPARLRLMSILSGHDVRFVAAGHTHQVRRRHQAGIDHVWAPSTAYTVPDFRQEPIGEKRVGVMTLELDASACHFTHLVPSGLTEYSLMDFPHIYPALIALRKQHGYED